MKTRRIPEYETKNPSWVEWAMLAAYIDGEGCIRIGTTPGRYVRTTRLLVIVSNNDPRLMVWLKEKFSGSVYSGKSPNGGLTYYSWSISNKQAEWVLRGCLDFFVIKRDQAEVGLAHQELTWRRNPGMPGGSNSETEPERMQLRNKLSLLKKTAGWQKDENGIPLRKAI